jgi:flagellar hook-associated protein 3 FlgL
MQSKIAQADQSNSTARHALEMTRARIVNVDPYESATRLEAAQIQLETLYALTARLGRLSLTDFLR